MNQNELISFLENLIDPTLKVDFKTAGSLININITDEDIVELVIALKNRKKDENQVKLEIARAVKIRFGYPGLRVDFIDSKFTLEEEKKIQYIGIISGKGGVGKSSVSANLAKALQRLGKKVGMIDADIYGSSLPSIFKLPIEPLSTTEDDEIIPADADGIQIISPEFFMPKNQPLMWRGPMLGKLLTHFFENVVWDDETDYIIIDLPPGTGDVPLDIHTFVPDAKMVLVTTPHPNASHVALKAGLGAKEMGHQVVGIVENMSYYFNPASKTKDFIFGEGGAKMVSEALDVDLLIQIPINQPMNKESYLYSLEDMNGKLYMSLAEKLLSKI